MSGERNKNKKISEDEWSQVNLILDELFEIPDSEQLNLLTQRCGNNDQLKQQVLQLLEAEKRAPKLLDEWAAELSPFQKEKNDSYYPALELTTIGPYKVCHEIGRGGMGIVYKAQRNDGQFEQQVAIKVLNAGDSNNNIIERFHREQQFLASLQHPHIARIYDGAQTEEGSSYFVMEYIKGQPIDQYCSTKKLSIKQRLSLIKQVIQALSFAHKNLIIHRDIKPGNILVDEDGQIKLLDFGIAKYLPQDSYTERTQTHHSMMTPSYAAPEQLKNQPATVQTDIYQLGLVIYQLLTGKQAFQDMASSYVDLLHKKSYSEPKLASAVYYSSLIKKNEEESKVTNDTFLLEQSIKQKNSWANKLSGDLDIILSKTLKSDPEQRYNSMDSLLSDINAFLDFRPINAHQTSLLYRLKMYFFRNWKEASITLLFATLLVSYAITVTLKSNQVEAALIQSQNEQQKSQRLSGLLINMFKATDPNVSGLEEITAEQLLDQGQEKTLRELKQSPRLQAYMLVQLGEIYFSQGKYDKSLELHEYAVQSLRSLNAPSLELANALTQLGVAYTHTQKLSEAKLLFEESLQLQEDLALSEKAEHSIDYAETHVTYAQLLRKTSQHKQAKIHFEKAIEIYRSQSGYEQSELAVALNGLANLQASIGNYSAARANMLEAINLHRKYFNSEHSYLSIYLNNFSILLTRMELLEEAKKYSDEALSIQQQILSPEHPYFAATYRSRAMIEYYQGNLNEAKRLLLLALENNQASLNSNNYITAMLFERLGFVTQELQDFESSKYFYDNMIETYRHLNAGSQVLARGIGRQASLAHDQGQLEQAEVLYLQALKQLPNITVKTSFIELGYGQLLNQTNREEKAFTILKKVLHLRQEKLGVSHSLTQEVEQALASIATTQN